MDFQNSLNSSGRCTAALTNRNTLGICFGPSAHLEPLTSGILRLPRLCEGYERGGDS